MLKIVVFTSVLCWSAISFGQQNTQKGIPLTVRQKNETIDSLLMIVNERYVFPDIAKKMEAHIRKLNSQNGYKNITNGHEFAQRLTQDLRSICKDLHLNVAYVNEYQAPEPERDITSIPAEQKEGLAQMLKHINYGIRKLDVLKGNIGYLDMEVFCAPEFAGDTYAAAMNYLAHTEALIIDLRSCGGSTSPDAIPFLCSYFFESPVHLNDLYWRKGNRTVQAWTYAYVPGKKYLNKPIYVLTSKGTFSGAEELAYDLQNLKRATIIGQATGGGANPGGDIRVTSHFRMFIPIGRAINPITKTNWEGVGVKPDTMINSKMALYKAQQLAMQHIIQTTKEEPWRVAVQGWLNGLEKPAFKPVTFQLKGFPGAKDVFVAGTFNDWSPNATRMIRQGDSWVVNTESEPGKIRYKFIVDGRWITDPDNDKTEMNGPNEDSVMILE